jgi:hypothetical protein
VEKDGLLRATNIRQSAAVDRKTGEVRGAFRICMVYHECVALHAGDHPVMAILRSEEKEAHAILALDPDVVSCVSEHAMRS